MYLHGLTVIVSMKRTVTAILVCTAALLCAESASGPAEVAEQAVPPATVQPSAGVMPAGPLFGPLTPEQYSHDPVPVPEPVWASVLAALALSVMRRGRR